jgi:fermentation-respiration switch protein FrsA (DUF1100 family)
MKIYTAILIFLLSGCSINITTDTFIYQDEIVEKQLDLVQIKTKLTHETLLTELSEIQLKTPKGLTLRGIKMLHKNALVNVVFFGGSGMKISTSSGILNQFSLLSANVIWFDYRGTGVSEKEESLNISDFKSDALNVFDFANKNLPNNIPTAIHGLSMGSLLATYVANNRTIDALVLDGAISSVPELVDNIVPSWSTLFSTVTVSPELAQINNLELIETYKNPLLFLVGEKDTTTPIRFSQFLYEASHSPVKTLEVIPNAKHGETMKKEKAIDVYKVFLANLTCCQKE